MKTFLNMRNFILQDAKQIKWEEFKEITNLSKLWDTVISTNTEDIRYTTFDGDKNVFLRFFYDYLVNGIDNFIRAYYERRIELRGTPEFELKLLNVKNNTIQNNPDAIRYIRSMFFEEMSVCGTKNISQRDGTPRLVNIRDGIRDMYEHGFILSPFFVPSVFKDYDTNDLSIIPESLIVTFRTYFGQMSVFSPNTYRTLLKSQQSDIQTGSTSFKLLCPTASWGTPVIAAKDLNYTDVHIVDVQKSVLDKCHLVKEDVFAKKTLFDDDAYNLKTFWTPSEKMAGLIDTDYDHVFFCPPYYDMEIYTENSDMQSTTLYPTYESWLDGYWRGTVNACYDNMKSGAVFSFTMNNHVEGKDIGDDMLRIAKERFKHIGQIKILNADKNLALNVKRYELAYELRKV